MKESAVRRLSRAVQSLLGVLFGEGVKRPTDHVRQVRGTSIPDINC